MRHGRPFDWRNARGQTTLEWVGLVVVSGIIASALFSGMPSYRADLKDGFQTIICYVSDSPECPGGQTDLGGGPGPAGRPEGGTGSTIDLPEEPAGPKSKPTENKVEVEFPGVNMYEATSSLAGFQCGKSVSDAELDALLQKAETNGVKLLRTWYFQSYYTKSSFRMLDRVLRIASAHKIKVVPVLINGPEHCGADTSGRWKDVDYWDTGWRKAGAWGDPLSGQAYIKLMGAHYKGDPRIAFWQLANEAETSTGNGTGCSKPRSSQVLRKFADDAGAALQSVDPSHAVSLGVMGAEQCGAQGEEYEYVHASPYIDICDYHDYNEETTAMPASLAKRIASCKKLGKPVMVTESGIKSSRTDRCALFKDKIDAAKAAGVQGYMVWNYGTAGESGDGFGIEPGDCALN